MTGYLTIDAESGSLVDSKPFVSELEAAIRRRYRVPEDERIEQWLGSHSARVQFRKGLRESGELGRLQGRKQGQ